jgi:hypothetical protein
MGMREEYVAFVKRRTWTYTKVNGYFITGKLDDCVQTAYTDDVQLNILNLELHDGVSMGGTRWFLGNGLV